MKFINNIILLLVIAFSLTSCSTTVFDRTPNLEKQETFPAKAIGKYNVKGYKGQTGDTGFVEISEKEINIIDNKVVSKMGISDSVMLFKEENMYVLALNLNNKENWELFPFKVKNNCIFVYPIAYYRYKKDLQKYFEETTNSKYGYKMNDQNFKLFINKKLKSKYALKLLKQKK